MFKRFFTLAMALVMALSCTAVASAVEIPEEDSDIAVTAAVQPRDAGNLGVPFTSKDTVATGWNFVQGTLNLEKNEYIKLSLANYDKCTLEIINQSNGAWSKTMNIGVSQKARTFNIWESKAPAGSYFFKLRFPSSESIFAGQFLWSDNK